MHINGFRLTAMPTASIGETPVISDSQLIGCAGRTYLAGALYIQHMSANEWLLTIENCQYVGKLSDMEAKLCEWATGAEYPAEGAEHHFPDFPLADIPAFMTWDNGWRDMSWRNDAMPFFVHQPSGVGVWLNYAGSDLPHDPRYNVVHLEWHEGAWTHSVGGDLDLFGSDDVALLEASLKHCIPPIALQHLTTVPIRTRADAESFIVALNAAGFAYHFDDNAVECLAGNGLMTKGQARAIGLQVARCYAVWSGADRDDCPIGHLLLCMAD